MKTHYRKAYKSDHLGVADLEQYQEEGKHIGFIFTIAYVRHENTAVAGKKDLFNIAYFKESGVKPLVLNSTNAEIVRKFSGGSAFVEDWVNIPVQLYIKRDVKMRGSVVGGVRIRPTKPRMEAKKPELNASHPKWEDVLSKLAKKEATLEVILKHFSVTEATEALLKAAENA